MAIALLKNKTKKNRIRKGRGNSSGHGGESGRGHKGQKSRSGFSRRAGFEGGQTPLYRRLPKKNGFSNSSFKKEYDIINVSQLNIFDDNSKIDLNILIKHNLAKKGNEIKVLGNGKLTKKLDVTLHNFSKTAINKIKKLKGSISILNK